MAGRRTAAACALVAVLAAAAPAREATPQTRGVTAFLALLDRYQRGEHDVVVAVLARWPADDIRMAVPEPLIEQMSASRLRSLAALHLDLMLAGVSTDHAMPAAERALRRLETTDRVSRPGIEPGAGNAEFSLRWRIAAASFLLWSKGAMAAGRLLDGGWPLRDDPRLALLEGSIQECSATDAWSGMEPLSIRTSISSRWNEFGAGERGRRSALLAAEAHYRKALAGTPTLAEARLRLGRVLAILDHPADARRELERATVDAPAGYLRYLAELFLGTLDERDGQYGAAEARYRRALTEYPGAQTAQLALGHLLESRGSSDAGWAEVRRAFAPHPARRGEPADPWLMYRDAQAWQLGDLVGYLREGARR